LRVAALQAQGRNVDDASSLAAADASLSMVMVAHLAQAAANVVFLGDRLALFPRPSPSRASQDADASEPPVRGRLQ
jgi:cation transport ATPase